MKWINILHIYQPPTQTELILGRVVSQCYEKIIALLDEYPELRLTLNISGSLLELLEKYGHGEVIAGFRRHAESGAVELLGSAMYHPILPLLSPEEIRRQIRLNDDISQRMFGDAYAPRGFYLPEMAYSAEAAKIIAEMGFAFVMLDEVHAPEPVDPKFSYSIRNAGLKVIFRDAKYSRTFPRIDRPRAFRNFNQYLITCHDGELYGHWHQNDYGYYEKAFTDPEITMLTASQYLKDISELPENKEGAREIAVRDASWESTEEELGHGVPHALWNDPKNDIHQALEKFKRKTLILVEKNVADEGYAEARHHADRGVASCAWWWASERRLGPFSPLTWNPTEIEKGARELHAAAQSLASLESSLKSESDQEFRAIIDQVWTRHQEKYDQDFKRIVE